MTDPVTDPPVTDPPVTDPPVTDPPVTDPPVTDPPVTDPPVTHPPGTDRDATGVAAPVFPPGRYGRRREPRPPRRWLVFVMASLTAIALGAIGYRLYTLYGNPQFTPLVLAETERTADHVTVRFEVRSDGREPALCLVRARAADGLVVGSAEVPVPAARRTTQTYTLATRERAFVVDIPRCRPATTDR